jgi:hypothetical protein
VNLLVIASFFSQLWKNLDLENVTAALETHTVGKSKAFVIFRLGWDFFYFGVMGFLFVICLFVPGSNIALHLRSPFAVVCLIVPLCALLKPIILSWYVLLFDRRFLSMPKPSQSEHGDVSDPAISEVTQTGLDNAQEPEPRLIRIVRAVTEHKALVVFDPAGILKDNNWPAFLCSPLTAFARPQLKKKLTFLASGFVLALFIAICVMDEARISTYQSEQESEVRVMQDEIDSISAKYRLGFEPVVHPHEARQGSDRIGLAVRIVLVVLVFPFTVLSNPVNLFLPRHASQLWAEHRPVCIAKIVGLAIGGVSIIALIMGAAARSFYPRYSLERVASGQVSMSFNFSDAECGPWDTVTFEEPHTICYPGGANWSLLQLAALPVLGEAWSMMLDRQDLFWLVRGLACLADIPLMRADERLSFASHVVLAYDPGQKRLAVAMPALSFASDFGVFCENFLTSYYNTLIDMIIPLYSVAYSNFLSDALIRTSQTMISGILGPNRLSVHHLDIAQLQAGLDLQIAWEVLEALGLSADRPLLVGHGANGLLAKAINISYDPWKISLEGPKLEDTPIAALTDKGAGTLERSRIFNFHTAGSFYSLDDERSLINTHFPKYGLLGAVPPGPFDTFCFAVAVCATDDRFDALCSDVIGKKRFGDIWTMLGRLRIAQPT